MNLIARARNGKSEVLAGSMFWPRRKPLLVGWTTRLTLWTSALIAVAPPLAAGEPERPNIIFVLTDDQAPWALGAAGHPDARTPNLDRLCREGVRLTNCFVATPVCSASRAAIMTSRYPTEVGVTDYLSPERQPDLGLDPSWPTWPRVLANAGYATGLVGKWHLGHADRYHPTRYGYAEFTGFRVGGETSKDPRVECAGKQRTIKGWTPDILTDFALDFVRRHQATRFCLSLHFWAPHANTRQHTPTGDRTWLPLSETDFGPFRNLDPVVPNPDYPNLDIPRVKRMTREYLGSVASVDRNVGRLLGLLDELRLTKRTVIIFTADHGYNLGHHGIWHKGNGRWILTNNRGSRPNLWDNSLRTPTIVRWPTVITPSAVVTKTVTFLDWFPTIVAMAGVEVPADTVLCGRNILPVLRGERVDWSDDLFAQYRMWQWNQTGADLRTYRTTTWKLVRDFRHTGKDELYDLVNDAQEQRNLIDSPDPRALAAERELTARLSAAMRRINDPATTYASQAPVSPVP